MAHPESVDSPQVGAVHPTAPRRTCVLFADDERALRTLARYVLEDSGYRVVLAEDGEQALEYFRADPEAVDLVVLDVTMPRMDGACAARAIREVDARVPTVLSSGWDDADVQPDLAIAGFLGKPWSPSRLVEEVRRLVGASMPVSRATGSG